MKSFTKYLIIGIIKSGLTLFLLWLFIDKINVNYKTLTRIIIILIIFVLSHYGYKLIGYTGDKE